MGKPGGLHLSEARNNPTGERLTLTVVSGLVMGADTKEYSALTGPPPFCTLHTCLSSVCPLPAVIKARDWLFLTRRPTPSVYLPSCRHLPVAGVADVRRTQSFPSPVQMMASSRP